MYEYVKIHSHPAACGLCSAQCQCFLGLAVSCCAVQLPSRCLYGRGVPFDLLQCPVKWPEHMTLPCLCVGRIRSCAVNCGSGCVILTESKRQYNVLIPGVLERKREPEGDVGG